MIKIKPIFGNYSSSNNTAPNQLIAIGGLLFFVVDDFEHGLEIWYLSYEN